MKVKAFASIGVTKPLGYFEFERREPIAKDVEIEVLYCGVAIRHPYREGEWERQIILVFRGTNRWKSHKSR